MPYLSRDKRRTLILDAAIKIAANEGFAGVTIRRISARLKMSAGNVHHVFASTSELKQEAFRRYTNSRFRRLETDVAKLQPDKRLFALVSQAAKGKRRDVMMVWTSAAQEAASDEAFAIIYLEEYRRWMRNIAEALVDISGGVMDAASANDAAMRLASFSTGMCAYATVLTSKVKAGQVDAHVQALLQRELAPFMPASTPSTPAASGRQEWTN